jgi:hypothetical protein
MGTIGNIYNAANTQPQQATPLVPIPSSPSGSSGPSFQDVLDTINPLQHIPVLSGIYRSTTGQNISTGAKFVGDTLYGIALGGTGLLSIATSVGSAAADAAVQSATGTDITGNVLNAISGNATPNTATAANTPTPLVPDTNSAAVAAAIQAATPPVPSVSPLFASDRDVQITSAQYHHAQVMSTLNKHLVNMNTRLSSQNQRTPAIPDNA